MAASDVPHERTGAAPSSLHDRWRSPAAEQRIGRLMVAVAVIGALVAVFGTVVGWVFVGQLADASDNTLEVTVQTLDAVDDTIDLADEVLVSTAAAVDALAGTVSAVAASFDSATTAIDDIASLADTIGPSLSTVGATVRNLQGIGAQVDQVLGALASLPIGPSYDPENGLGGAFGDLADTLEALPGELAATSESLTTFTGNAGDLQDQLDGFADSVAAIGTDLGDTGALVEQYRASVAGARALATQTTDDLNSGVVLTRILLIAGGVALLLGQIVPLWLGRWLLLGRPSDVSPTG